MGADTLASCSHKEEVFVLWGMEGAINVLGMELWKINRAIPSFLHERGSYANPKASIHSLHVILREWFPVWLSRDNSYRVREHTSNLHTPF